MPKCRPVGTSKGVLAHSHAQTPLGAAPHLRKSHAWLPITRTVDPSLSGMVAVALRSRPLFETHCDRAVLALSHAIMPIYLL